MVMDKTVLLAKENGVQVGAHPSLPDRQGFGRREMAMEPVCVACCSVCRNVLILVEDELAACFVYQVGALSGFLHQHGLKMNHVGFLELSILLMLIILISLNHMAPFTDSSRDLWS